MLWNVSVINGYAIMANDGRLGTVSDFLFGDATWLVRWLVADTGNWLPGRKVLLPRAILGHLDAGAHEFSVELTMRQVKDSPDIDTERPVSRQVENSIYDHYGWSAYWTTGFYVDSYGYAGDRGVASMPLGSARRGNAVADAQQSDDPHLRSIKAVTGYQSMRPTARSAMSRTSWWRMQIGASITSSSIRRTGGPAIRS